MRYPDRSGADRLPLFSERGEAMPRTVHGIPEDEPGHDLTEQCPCGPTIHRPDGTPSNHRAIIHNSDRQLTADETTT